MLPPPCYLISDVHLGHAPESVERALLAFLRSLPGRAGSLLINGDLFEFWFEWRSVVPRSGVRALAALMDLRDAGVPMTMLAGNHDCWGGDILREAGVDFLLGPLQDDVGGWRARVEHGDGLREKEDRGYRMLRRVLRNRLAIRAFGGILHPDFASRLAMGSSQTSRSYAPRDEGRGLRSVAATVLQADPSLELVVYGHSHIAALERTPPTKASMTLVLASAALSSSISYARSDLAQSTKGRPCLSHEAMRRRTIDTRNAPSPAAGSTARVSTRFASGRYPARSRSSSTTQDLV